MSSTELEVQPESKAGTPSRTLPGKQPKTSVIVVKTVTSKSRNYRPLEIDLISSYSAVDVLNVRLVCAKDGTPAPETAPPGPPPRLRRPAREATFEFLHAPPLLVAEFNAARSAYHEAIFTWWHASGKRTRGMLPSDAEYEAAKLDPGIIAAGELLDEMDAKLSEYGTSIRQTVMRNDREVPRQLRIEERNLDKQFYEAKRSLTHMSAAAADDLGGSGGAPPTKRQRLEDGSAATPGNSGTPLRGNTPLRVGGISTAASTVVLRRPATSRQSTAQLSEHRSAASPAPSATSSSREVGAVRATSARRSSRRSTNSIADGKN